MNKLWSQRLNRYLKELGKYGQLIFNDHFAIILLILFAFAALYYQQLLGQLQVMEPELLRLPGSVLVAVILAVVFQLGRPIWLTKDPDKSYLYPRAKEWQTYWLQGSLLSLVLPLILLFFATVLLMPFAAITTSWQVDDLLLFYLLIAVFKVGASLMEYLTIFGLAINRDYQSVRLIITLLFLITVFISNLVIAPLNLIVLALVAGGLLIYGLIGLGQRSSHWADFQYVIDQEESRMSRLYRWISIFADVPQMTVTVKSASFLDGLLLKLPFVNQDRYSYLYSRAMIRNSAFSGIWMRVMFFIGLLILLTQSAWLVLGLGLVGHILTVIQLMPLMTYYRHQPFQKIYPHRQDSPVVAFQKTLALIIGLQSLVYGVLNLIGVGLTITPWVNLGLWLLIGAVLIFFYVPWWYKRQK